MWFLVIQNKLSISIEARLHSGYCLLLANHIVCRARTLCKIKIAELKRERSIWTRSLLVRPALHSVTNWMSVFSRVDLNTCVSLILEPRENFLFVFSQLFRPTHQQHHQQQQRKTRSKIELANSKFDGMKHESRNPIGFSSLKPCELRGKSRKNNKIFWKQKNHLNSQSLLHDFGRFISFKDYFGFYESCERRVCVSVEVAQCRFTPSDCFPRWIFHSRFDVEMSFKSKMWQLDRREDKTSILNQFDNNERLFVMLSCRVVINYTTQAFDGSLESILHIELIKVSTQLELDWNGKQMS